MMTVLVVDDDPLSREAIGDFISENLGHRCVLAATPEEALREASKAKIDLVVADIRLDRASGLDLVQSIRSEFANDPPEFILVTGYADVNSSVRALRMAVTDYLQKPVNVDELTLAVNRVRQKRSGGEARTQKGAPKVHTAGELYPVVCTSLALRLVCEQAELLHSQRSVPVLIEGETGVGKEVVARLIHGTEGPFVGMNCAAIPETLFESELFGYEEGAFTGARAGGAPGRFEIAEGGTLLLDEINELPLDMQAKLLRVLQEKAYRRVGGGAVRQADVRVVCTSNRNLDSLVSAGAFRADLFYRIAVGRIVVPALRERPDDIVPLAEHFLRRSSVQLGKRFFQIADDARTRLLHYHWPGNVRELRNVIERAVLLADGESLQARHIDLPTRDTESDSTAQLEPGSIRLPDEPFSLAELEHEIVAKAIERFDGNKTRAAEYLGLTRSALRSRLGGASE